MKLVEIPKFREFLQETAEQFKAANLSPSAIRGRVRVIDQRSIDFRIILSKTKRPKFFLPIGGVLLSAASFIANATRNFLGIA